MPCCAWMPGHATGPRTKQAAAENKVATRLAAPVAVINLPALGHAKVALQDEGGARQIGVARDVAPLARAEQTQAVLSWVALPNGGHAAALQLAVAGAFGVRLGIRWQALAADAVLRLYAGAGGLAMHEVTGAALLDRLPVVATSGERIWWTPDIGPEPVLEIVLPPGMDVGAAALSIPQLSEIVLPPAQLAAESAAQANADLMLPKRRFQRLPERRGTANSLLAVAQRGHSHGDQAAYVLTVAHCAKDQAVASTLQTSWFYYSQSCDSDTLYTGNAERYNGARWLASSLDNDMTLLELLDTPPEGAVFAGWDATPQPMGAAISAIHHPSGDLQKFNRGAIREEAACTVDYEYRALNCNPGAQSDGSFYRVELTVGAIEGGSSGSALLVDGRVVGTLTGGDFWCASAGAQVVYGRLDQAMRSSFQPWLGAQLSSESSRQPVYQFHIPQSGADFYTVSSQERDSVIASLAGVVNYVGVAFDTAADSAPGTIAVHRFFNPSVVAHFYTANEAESEHVKKSNSQWRYEGIAWYAPAQPQQDEKQEARAVWRFYCYSTDSTTATQG
ncbi:hypothetical protein FQA39_LY18652 [Lamprigera yunnana]|nr:hypothetical protein FQA39_LY18652 [Lamprigera yunnana]